VGQRTFETGSLYLILAEKWFTLPAANEMLSLSALFAGKYREVGQWDVGILEEAATEPLESGRLGDRQCWQTSLKLPELCLLMRLAGSRISR
jgi:hypothetical protein